MNLTMKNHTWELVSLSLGKSFITLKWVFKLKEFVDNQLNIHKACLLARGFKQIKRLDYTKNFLLVIKWGMLWIIVALVVKHNWPMFHLSMRKQPFSMVIYVKKSYDPTTRLHFGKTRR